MIDIEKHVFLKDVYHIYYIIYVSVVSLTENESSIV